MIAAWMLYATAVAAALAGAAGALERACRLARRPARLVWLGAMLAAVLIAGTALALSTGPAATPPLPNDRGATTAAPVAAAVRPAGGAPVRAPSATRRLRPLLPPVVLVPRVAPLSALDRTLLILWGAASAAWLAVLALSAARLRRERRSWRPELVDEVPVLVSPDVGPAVVGVLRARIVVPAWVADLDSRRRALVLAHEREHARAADPLIVICGAVAVLLAPWNSALWYMLRRLRLAAEMDCDRRVLRAHPDARAYASLLLDVGERALPGAVSVATLVEPASFLERRITAMTSPRPRHAALRLAGSVLAGALLAAVACRTPRPYSPPPPRGPDAERSRAAEGTPARSDSSVRVVGADTATAHLVALLRRLDSLQRSDSVQAQLQSLALRADSLLRSDSTYSELQRMLDALDSARRSDSTLARMQARMQAQMRLADSLLRSDSLFAELQRVVHVVDSLRQQDTAGSRTPPTAPEDAHAYYDPSGEELRTLVRRYQPEALARPGVPGTIVAFVFDARDSVARHTTVPSRARRRALSAVPR